MQQNINTSIYPVSTVLVNSLPNRLSSAVEKQQMLREAISEYRLRDLPLDYFRPGSEPSRSGNGIVILCVDQ